MDIGALIKQNRLQLNLSMNELSRRSGVGQSGISEIESGKRLPTFDNLERLITLGFRTTISDFFAEDTPPVTVPPHLQELMADLNQLTPAQLEAVKHIIKTLNDGR